MNARERRFMARYGITTAEYEAMLIAQDYRCAACRAHHPMRRGHAALHVDHDHVTGRVRGLLCRRCNTTLGMVGDNELLLQKLTQYLIDSQMVDQLLLQNEGILPKGTWQ